ncbi:MAG: hypothetical protein M3094_02675 [Actinomycetia bacterium]|nr:hypothetical protein [Actinomycetes bacterium]
MTKFRMYESELNRSDHTRFLGTNGEGLKVFVAIRAIVGTVASRFVANDTPEAAFERAGKPKVTAELSTMPAGTVFLVAANQYEKIQYGKSKGRYYIFPLTGGQSVEAATEEHAASIAELVASAEKEDATVV